MTSGCLPSGGRGPSDIHDPSEDGYVPRTLDEVVAAGEAALAALQAFEEAVDGCMTPLNLIKVRADLRSLSGRLQTHAADLREAQRIIASRSPIKALSSDGTRWSMPAGAYGDVTLSPSQIRYFAKDASGAGETTTYLEHLVSHRPLPAIAANARDKARRAAEREELWALQQRILDDVEAGPCPSCGAEAGSECITSSGNQTSPHAARINASDLARRNRKAARAAHRPYVEPGKSKR